MKIHETETSFALRAASLALSILATTQVLGSAAFGLTRNAAAPTATLRGSSDELAKADSVARVTVTARRAERS
jgi:hypothetical protein